MNITMEIVMEYI